MWFNLGFNPYVSNHRWGRSFLRCFKTTWVFLKSFYDFSWLFLGYRKRCKFFYRSNVICQCIRRNTQSVRREENSCHFCFNNNNNNNNNSRISIPPSVVTSEAVFANFYLVYYLLPYFYRFIYCFDDVIAALNSIVRLRQTWCSAVESRTTKTWVAVRISLIAALEPEISWG